MRLWLEFVCVVSVVSDDMNWSLCAICQEETSDPVRCPLDSLQTRSGYAAYEAFLHNVKVFTELDCLPVALPFGPAETVENFVAHRARWHARCHVKFNNCNFERVVSRKRKLDASDAERSVRSKRQQFDYALGIFCEKEKGKLHEVTAYEVDQQVRQMATALLDTSLLTKQEGSDMVPRKVKYHSQYMVELKNRHRSLERKDEQADRVNLEDQIAEDQAFVELVSYVKETTSEGGPKLFKLSDLAHLNDTRLVQLNVAKEIHKTRLKQRILNYSHQEIQEQSDGRNVVLVFNADMKRIIKDVLSFQQLESDDLILSKAAKMVRQQIFNRQGFKFNGQFSSHCQQESVPPQLLDLISMVLNGTSIQDQESEVSQACLTIVRRKQFDTHTNESLLFPFTLV